MTQIIILLIYIFGSFISYWMLLVDHVSEGKTYTQGAKVLNILLSILSWVMVLVALISAWYVLVKRTGYWDKPVNIKPESK